MGAERNVPSRRFYQDFFIAGTKAPSFLRAADHHGRIYYT
jgi:hypothetical protein